MMTCVAYIYVHVHVCMHVFMKCIYKCDLNVVALPLFTLMHVVKWMYTHSILY
jgi:hypothetical protein